VGVTSGTERIRGQAKPPACKPVNDIADCQDSEGLYATARQIP